MTPADACIDEAARFLLRFGSVDRALATHRLIADGRCFGCGGRVGWPCPVAASAVRARTLPEG